AQAQRSWSMRQSIQENIGWMFANEVGQRGQLKAFQQLMRAHARELIAAGFKGPAADDLARLALVEAELGDTQGLSVDAAATLAAARGRAELSHLAISFALVGANAQAQALLEEVESRFPHYFLARRVYVPLARALMLAHEGKTSEALQTL